MTGPCQADRIALFDPIRVDESACATRFLLKLDADEPYLRDHRPGGVPLFSTVMGLEAVVAAARGLATAERLPTAGDSELSPRLIEFALQCAGLLELAESGRMMIPDAIARIERFLPLDVDHVPLWARAARSTAAERATDVAAIAAAAIDIEVVDELDRLVLRVERYRTLPLPFPMNAGAATRLRRRLVGSNRLRAQRPDEGH